MLVSSTSEFPLNNCQALDRKRSNSNVQTNSGLTSPQFSSYGSSPSSQKSSSFMPLYQRPRGLSIAENDAGNVIQLEMITNSYNGANADEYSDLPSLVLKANIGMKRGVKPVLADGAMGGTYFLRDENQKFAVVCKPGDEEPNSPHNPHQQTKQQQSGGETALVWRGWYRGRIVPGFGMYREVAAFLLDAGFAGVPPTQLARVRDYLLRLEAEPFVQSNCITDGVGSDTSSCVSVTPQQQNVNKIYEPLHSSAASVYKICSVQSYARHECSAEDMGSSKFYTDDVHRIAALDIRLCNLDRHEGNILVTKSNPYIRVALPAAVSPTSITSNADHTSSGSSGGETTDDNSSAAMSMIFNWEEDSSSSSSPATDAVVDHDHNKKKSEGGKYHLVPIDHGYVLPHVLCMNDPSLSWMNWSQSREPLSPSLLRHIASLDYTRDAELLRRVVGAALAETSLLTLQVCTSFLKKGSAAGLTLYEMGTAMCPPPPPTNTTANGDINKVQSLTTSTSTTNNIIINTINRKQQSMSQLQKVVHLAVHSVLLLLHHQRSSPRGVNEYYNSSLSSSPSSSSSTPLSSTDDCTYKSILLKRLHATTAAATAADSTPQAQKSSSPYHQSFRPTNRSSSFHPQHQQQPTVSSNTAAAINNNTTSSLRSIEPETIMTPSNTVDAIISLPELLLPEVLPRQPSPNTESLEALNLFDSTASTATDDNTVTADRDDAMIVVADENEEEDDKVNCPDRKSTATASSMIPLSLSGSPLSNTDIFLRHHHSSNNNRHSHPMDASATAPLPPPLQRTQSHTTPRHSPITTTSNATTNFPHNQSSCSNSNSSKSHEQQQQSLSHTVHTMTTTTNTSISATIGQSKPPVVPSTTNDSSSNKLSRQNTDTTTTTSSSNTDATTIPLHALYVVPVSEEMLKQAMNMKYNNHNSSSNNYPSPLSKELDQWLDRLVNELLLQSSSAAQYL